MKILGISAFYHDSAAALVINGTIVAAAQEERFSRIKHDAAFPDGAIRYCLEEAGISLNDLDQIVFFEKPFVKFERLLETYTHFAPRGLRSFTMAMPLWLREKLFQKKVLRDGLEKISKTPIDVPLAFSEHHLSHAASAFYPSPFEEALVLTMDGVGEWATTTAAIGQGSTLKIYRELHFPNSLGLLYSAFTYHCGFKVNSGEYKLMGLAPYGEPRFVEQIKEHLIQVKPDGSFRMDQTYFNYCVGLTMTNQKFSNLFGIPVRSPESELTQEYMDLAASIQKVTEEIVVRLATNLQQETGQKNLCLAGGVALNCVANGVLRRTGAFDNIWIQPAAGDAGGALGAALYAYYAGAGNSRTPVAVDAMQGSYLGTSFSKAECAAILDEMGAVYTELSEDEVLKRTAELLANGNAVGWFQGRMEFGPRALGNRSILGDPRDPETQKTLNLKIKYRESFRPFAPSVLEENVSDWFATEDVSPYMLMVDQVAESRRHDVDSDQLKGLDRLYQTRSQVPAITHVDGSARIQTVSRLTNPKYHQLISEFGQLTGCPMLVNTSFNIRGEPIVCTPADAFRCFMGTEMDALVIGDLLLIKNEQSDALAQDYRSEFNLD